MALPKSSQVYINNIIVVVYDYEHAGDTLPVHDHKARLYADHFVVVCAGEFEVLTAGGEVRTLAGAGDIVKWEPGTPHGFRAKSDNARAMHIRAADLRDLAVPAGVAHAGVVAI